MALAVAEALIALTTPRGGRPRTIELDGSAVCGG